MTSRAPSRGTRTRHVPDCISIDIRSETEACATSTWAFYTDTDSTPKLDGIGRYVDTFRFESGRWKLARRKIFRG
ncbi:nuclear transport factor 2 family protein [Rhodococcus sp. OK302]|uniref:nuclear transport factor 2 family protein n=1 Tax=Rhodococcus sp. OK302 TaxID=1882769 RepID=UPI000B945EEC